jgi:hypothetical protein
MRWTVISSGVKYLSNNSLKYLSSFGGWSVGLLYYLYFLQLLLLLYYIPKENHIHFTPYFFPHTQKYLLHFECLAWKENGPIHSLIKRTSLVIPTASDLADSINTNAYFVKKSVGVCPKKIVLFVWLNRRNMTLFVLLLLILKHIFFLLKYDNCVLFPPLVIRKFMAWVIIWAR